jgi:HPt (histidine-containing phosphotransfer) domain-containing protein/CheY-like chemotaxis protein
MFGGLMSGMSKTDIHALRFLLIHGDPEGADRLASLLATAHHVVVATPNLAEATEALCIERFDAIVLDAALPLAEVAEFSAGLRRIEERQGLARIPVVSISSETAVNSSLERDRAAWDAWLQEPLDPAALTEAVTRLAQAVGHPAAQPAAVASESPILEPEEFEEQMGGDRELMVEIIDLFFEERQRQVAEMRHALASGNFTQLSRLAHTIKGSLGSLRATRARWGAHELESTAAGGDANRCRESFSSFEQDLTELEPELRLLRDRVAGQLPTL